MGHPEPKVRAWRKNEIKIPTSAKTGQKWGTRPDVRRRRKTRIKIQRKGVLGHRCVNSRQLQSLPVQRKIFWMVFALLGLVADFLLPFWWACAATIPILFAAWWVAYRSDWF
jgi:hypothetical protein